MIKRALLATLLSWQAVSYAGSTEEAFKVLSLPRQFDACLQHFPDQFVPFKPTSEYESQFFELCFDDFAVLYSGLTKTPLFAVELITPTKLDGAKAIKRFNEFYEDLRIPQKYRSTLEDYNRSQFDRGHFAPAGNRHDDNTMAQSFALSNIAPQDPVFNRGVWAKIESDVRSYVRRTRHSVYTYTGVLFARDGSQRTIGNQVYVPQVFYKIVYDPHPDEPRAWVYWNDNHAKTRLQKPISIQEFTDRTGMKFLKNPPTRGID